MKRCKTCKWWTEIGGAFDGKERIGREWHLIPQRDCKCPKVVDQSDPEITWASLPADAAGYSDCEDYAAIFRTGPEFGCIHQEEIIHETT